MFPSGAMALWACQQQGETLSRRSLAASKRRRPRALLLAFGASVLAVGPTLLLGRDRAPQDWALVQHAGPELAAGPSTAETSLLSWMLQDVYRASFLPLFGITAAMAWLTRPKAGDDGLPPDYLEFQRQFQPVWILAIAADWLQGPYVYALYASYGYSPADIARLFVAGFGSSMVCGTFIGALADAWGRKRCALLYCVLYIASCATKHFNNFELLMVGRVLGGIATSLLFSTFECWMVAEHRIRKFSEGLLRYSFGLMFFVQYLAAIASGILAQAAADAVPLTSVSGLSYGGYTAPFDLSAILLVLALPAIALLWSENYGDQEAPTHGFIASFCAAGKAFCSSWQVPLLGIAVASFEGSMYAFVFNWTPAVNHDAAVTPPCGLIFSTFMMACMCGSSLFSLLGSSLKSTKVLLLVCLAGALALGMVTLSLERHLGPAVVYAGFLAFEACVGAYFPAAGTVKSEVVPEDARAGIYNIYRVPLNAVVVLLLLTDLPLRASFGMCCGLLGLAAFATFLLLQTRR